MYERDTEEEDGLPCWKREARVCVFYDIPKGRLVTTLRVEDPVLQILVHNFANSEADTTDDDALKRKVNRHARRAMNDLRNALQGCHVEPQTSSTNVMQGAVLTEHVAMTPPLNSVEKTTADKPPESRR